MLIALATVKMLLPELVLLAQFAPFSLAAPTSPSPFGDVPAPPEPEPIEVVELPLPPSTEDVSVGGCTAELSPSGTGCIKVEDGLLQSGSFLRDNKHIVVRVNFTGAPAAPDPASIYTGDQIILVKSDNTTFSNGDAWKCITCGIPEENSVGRANILDYPQAFVDNKRILAGTNIISCGDFDISSEGCTPERAHIYPIRWDTAVNGSGAGGEIRELRLHPDGVHLGFNSFSQIGGKLGQVAYIGRLVFNPSPTTGMPLAPRYDLANVTMLFNSSMDMQPIVIDGNKIKLQLHVPTVGELRGFSGTGQEVTYVGSPIESDNIDVFAANLATGKVRRLTAHPEYCDPVDISPDDKWTAAMDTRASGRQMFMAGMRGIPPITDLVTTTVASSTRNNGQRRFFQPFLIDQYGDRGNYFGQQINGAGDGSPGSLDDPNWNGMADPKFSPDGTMIVYWQTLVVPPACGGENPLPCPVSTAPYGRTERMMLATLTSRKPLDLPAVKPISDFVPWGTPYVPGSVPEARYYPPGGEYTLEGASSGYAKASLVENSDKTGIISISMAYYNYSDDGISFLNGYENATGTNPSITLNVLDYFANLTRTGPENSTKITSEDGFHIEIDVMTNIFVANGTLVTTVDGKEYHQPANGT